MIDYSTKLDHKINPNIVTLLQISLLTLDQLRKIGRLVSVPPSLNFDNHKSWTGKLFSHFRQQHAVLL